MTEYRIDDLAREAGTTTRNVRGYQDRGLLPRPLRRGRIAIYTDQHLARLKVINDLLGRGFTIRHIGDFLSGMQRGDDLAHVLGLREAVTERWSQTTPTSVTADELEQTLRTADPKQWQRLSDFRLIRAESAGAESAGAESAGAESTGGSPPNTYAILDPETVTAYGELVAQGMSLDDILDVHAALDKAMDSVANTLISAGRRRVTEGHDDGWIPTNDDESERTTRLLMGLRRAGQVSAHNALDRALDREMKRQLADYLTAARESGHDPDSVS
ncbi:MerR family transcriptional regulator [Gordonia sp. NPDC003950]